MGVESVVLHLQRNCCCWDPLNCVAYGNCDKTVPPLLQLFKGSSSPCAPLALNSQLFSISLNSVASKSLSLTRCGVAAKGWCWQVAAADAWTEKMNGCVGRSSSKDSIQEQRRTTWHNLNLGCSSRREKMRNKRQSGVVWWPGQKSVVGGRLEKSR